MYLSLIYAGIDNFKIPRALIHIMSMELLSKEANRVELFERIKRCLTANGYGLRRWVRNNTMTMLHPYDISTKYLYARTQVGKIWDEFGESKYGRKLTDYPMTRQFPLLSDLEGTKYFANIQNIRYARCCFNDPDERAEERGLKLYDAGTGLTYFKIDYLGDILMNIILIGSGIKKIKIYMGGQEIYVKHFLRYGVSIESIVPFTCGLPVPALKYHPIYIGVDCIQIEHCYCKFLILPYYLGDIIKKSTVIFENPKIYLGKYKSHILISSGMGSLISRDDDLGQVYLSPKIYDGCS